MLRAVGTRQSRSFILKLVKHFEEDLSPAHKYNKKSLNVYKIKISFSLQCCNPEVHHPHPDELTLSSSMFTSVK